MSARVWEQLKARAMRLVMAAAEKQARRIARSLAAELPDLTIEADGADVTISGRDLTQRRERDARLRFAGRLGLDGSGPDRSGPKGSDYEH